MEEGRASFSRRVQAGMVQGRTDEEKLPQSRAQLWQCFRGMTATDSGDSSNGGTNGEENVWLLPLDARLTAKGLTKARLQAHVVAAISLCVLVDGLILVLTCDWKKYTMEIHYFVLTSLSFELLCITATAISMIILVAFLGMPALIHSLGFFSIFNDVLLSLAYSLFVGWGLISILQLLDAHSFSIKHLLTHPTDVSTSPLTLPPLNALNQLQPFPSTPTFNAPLPIPAFLRFNSRRNLSPDGVTSSKSNNTLTSPPLNDSDSEPAMTLENFNFEGAALLFYLVVTTLSCLHSSLKKFSSCVGICGFGFEKIRRKLAHTPIVSFYSLYNRGDEYYVRVMAADMCAQAVQEMPNPLLSLYPTVNDTAARSDGNSKSEPGGIV